MNTNTFQPPEPPTVQDTATARTAIVAPPRTRIAYLINQYPQPSQSFIRREIAALERSGFEIERFTLRASRQDELVDPTDAVEHRRTQSILGVGPLRLALATVATFLSHPLRFLSALNLAIKIGRRSDRGLPIHLIYLAEACVLLSWTRRANLLHLHAHFGTNSTTVAMLCHALGGPTYSFTCHGPEEFDRAPAIALAEKIRRAKFVVAISHFGKSQLYRHCEKSHWNKIHVIRCGVDSMFLQSQVPPLPRGNKIVCVGRLCEQKGQLLLVEAAARLAAEKLDFQLVLIGDGPMRADIQRLIDRHELNSYVTITGWMNSAQVRQQMIESRAVVLPSFAEGLPVVLMEALALHRPVISTYVAGIPELVENQKTGWLVPAGDINALVDILHQSLAASPSQLAQMGAAGAEKVSRLHNVDTEAEKLAGLLTET